MWWAEQWLLATDARWTGATQPPVSRSGVTRRDTDLWGDWVYHYAVAVYRYDQGCSQVNISMDPPVAGSQKRGYADPAGASFRRHHGVVGRTRAWNCGVQTWSDAGLRRIDARVKPSNGLRSGARWGCCSSSGVARRQYRCLKRVRTRLTCGLWYARAGGRRAHQHCPAGGRPGFRRPGIEYYRRTTPPWPPARSGAQPSRRDRRTGATVSKGTLLAKPPVSVRGVADQQPDPGGRATRC